ncbi:hypothetical protein KR032_001623 [Drosophila birchii]|nr:hypothetical protein KR032_001623 [Drosophila birchii]
MPSVPVNTDQGLQSVSSANKNAFRSPGPLQTKRPLPKSSEPASSVKRNPESSSKSPGQTVSSKQTSASSAPAQAPGLKANGSVTSPNKDKDLAFKRPGLLRTRIPITSPAPKGKQNRKAEPECSAKQNLKNSKNTNRKSKLASKTNLALETQLADELDKRNRSINELEMKLVQNENLVSEQALRLAESKADQRAKDVAMEQLKSELFSAKDEYNLMQLRLKEADLGLEQATCKVNKYLEQSNSFEDELKEARNKIVNLQTQLRDANTKAENHCQIKAKLHQDLERLQEQLALDSKLIDCLQQSERDLKEDLGKKDGLINQVDRRLIPLIALPGLILLLMLRR